jgi:SAM-dependent methyltransferase
MSPHDGFADGTWPALRALLPEPGPGPVIDLGCGEGRGSRELRALGHQVVGADYSASLTQAARASCPAIPVLRADAAALPFAARSADLVVACMSLLDFDDFAGAAAEIGCVLRPGGQVCLAVVHPFISALDEDTQRTAFRVSRPYLRARRYTDRVERDGMAMTFSSMHRPLSDYTSALFGQGMVITALSEGGDGVIPWLLAMRADKLPR